MAIIKHARCPVVENLVKTGWICTSCKHAETSDQPECCPKCRAVVEPNYGFEPHKADQPVVAPAESVAA